MSPIGDPVRCPACTLVGRAGNIDLAETRCVFANVGNVYFAVAGMYRNPSIAAAGTTDFTLRQVAEVIGEQCLDGCSAMNRDPGCTERTQRSPAVIGTHYIEMRILETTPCRSGQ